MAHSKPLNPRARAPHSASEEPVHETAAPWRRRLHEVIFEADTPAGRAFDVALLAAIVLSILVVSLESIATTRAQHGPLLRGAEWVLTILFTIEYVLRLVSVRRPLLYARSFFGVVDLLAILPTYLSLLFPGTEALVVIRSLRLLRVFRVLKMLRFLREARMLEAAMLASTRKILIFIGTVLTVVLIAGTMLYVIEGPASGYDNIPLSVYWAIVTMTTVGFGDIVPQTGLGRLIASALMILGYGIIAVPTGIVTVELAESARNASNTQACPTCGREGHANDARFCKHCGSSLEFDVPPAEKGRRADR
jgi:voltage-gated potassium channel